MQYERTAVSEVQLRNVGSRFAILGDFVSGAPYGSGHINDTFAVAYNQAGTPVRYVFQRINHGVFRDPVALMDNIARVTQHNQQTLDSASGGVLDRSRRGLTVVPARDGNPYVRDDASYYWRCYLFLENAKTYDQIENTTQAYQVAAAFGRFQQLLSDLGGERLHETIPDFHNTAQRYQTLLDAVERDPLNRAKDVKAEIDFFTQRESDTHLLLDLQQQGLLPERVTHNDCKLNNVMLDDETGAGICVIDLDTVMPGLALYDFGDMVRTATSPALEDEPDVSKVKMQMPMFEALVKGYLHGTGEMLTAEEIEQIPFSGKLITLTIGIRFLTDYLEGDKYFKVHRDGHNLDRCRTQIALVSSIESQHDAMHAVVAALTHVRVTDSDCASTRSPK